MTNFQLSPFVSISGIGAASGIVLLNNQLYIIGDNSGFLYQYDLSLKVLKQHSIIENPVANIPKKEKPDFESITLKNYTLYIFGSGSTKKREIRIKFDLQTQETKSKDLSKLYKKLKEVANFTDDDLNIEGTFFYVNNLYLLNRGNTELSKNGIFRYDKSLDSIAYQPIKLPIINNIETSFTDAIVHENKIYFLATAENSSSTYLDGEIYGSIIGIINIENMEIEHFLQISNNQKFEGLTFYNQQENEVNFLICEDNDTENLVSEIYQLKVNFKESMT